jgi:hypothetical protein
VRGLEGAAALVADHLRVKLPDKCAELATRLAVDPEEVPPPRLVAVGERSQLEPAEWPAVLVVGLDATNFRMVDLVDGADEVYEVTYRLRSYGWIRGDTFEEVEAIRARLALAQREVLLEKRSLGDAAGARVEGETFRESYSDLETDDAGRSLGGVYLEFLLTLTETLTSADLKAPPLTVKITGAGEHPALD